MIPVKKIFIDSHKRTIDSESTTNFKIDLPESLLFPENTVFIDDNLDNINTAIELNFKTIHLVDPDLIKQKIRKYLNYSK